MTKEMAAALIIDGDKILLVHNTKHARLRIEPPGGKKQKNETHEQCAARECLEELGIGIKIERLFGVYGTHSPEGGFDVRLYLSKIETGEIKLNEPEKISGFGWYTLDEIDRLKKNGSLVPNMVDAVKDIAAHIEGASQ